MQNKYLIALVVSVVVVVSALFLYSPANNENKAVSGQCEINQLVYYYSKQCSWCKKVEDEGTIEKLQNLGVKVQKIDVAVGLVNHQFQGVPTFVINNQVLSGYKTFEELKGLLKCSDAVSEQIIKEDNLSEKDYSGTKGEQVVLKNNKIEIDVLGFEDNIARFYNTEMPSGKIIYFFVVQDKNGIYRAAANECQVCYSEKLGFRQEGEEMVCNNCGNRYPVEKIATEKGGCNPGPINPNLEVANGKVDIQLSDLEQIINLF